MNWALIGGILGGALLLLVLASIAADIYIKRRRQRRQEGHNSENDDSRDHELAERGQAATTGEMNAGDSRPAAVSVLGSEYASIDAARMQEGSEGTNYSGMVTQDNYGGMADVEPEKSSE